jgi:NAD-dependent dihydropyrimidine dehydrogenase PreA subunit
MICYFSATGNTAWVARQLADATGETLVDIAKHPDGTLPQALAEDERLGFCFPVHGWLPPTIVRHFVRQLKVSGVGHYIYMVCTAGDTIGETADVFAKDLASVHLHFDAAFSVIMPNTYVGLPFMDVDSAELQATKKQQATADLKRHITDIVNRRAGVRHTTPGRWPRINTRVLGSFFGSLLTTDKPFHVDSSRCVKCGICADVCPVANIRGGLGYEPQWLHNGRCLTCFACYHHCPHHAIAYGNRTRHKGQYFFNRINNKK